MKNAIIIQLVLHNYTCITPTHSHMQSGGICWNKNNPKGCRDYKVQYICPKYTVPTCNNGAEQLTVQDEELIAEVENYQTGDYDPEVVSNDEEVGQESPEGKSLVEEMLMQELLHTLTQ